MVYQIQFLALRLLMRVAAVVLIPELAVQAAVVHIRFQELLILAGGVVLQVLR
jgi:hypothetical protein